MSLSSKTADEPGLRKKILLRLNQPAARKPPSPAFPLAYVASLQIANERSQPNFDQLLWQAARRVIGLAANRLAVTGHVGPEESQ